jgi:DNA-binding phage protein
MPSVEGVASPGLLLVTVTNGVWSILRKTTDTFGHSASETGKTMNAEGVMDNIRNAFERSGMTLNELGKGLGYDGQTAKKHAWLLLYRTSNPRISTVLAVASALDVKISDLVK